MAAERNGNDPVREFRLEGAGLFVVGGLLIALLGGAFYVGRWYERGLHPSSGEASLFADEDPLANVVDAEEPADVDSTADYFDTLEGAEKQAEPSREAQERAAAPQPAAQAPRTDAGAPADDGGPWFVQVFAGRDRNSVDDLRRQLEAAGHRVKIVSSREGQGALYKVRVGGFPTKPDADAAAKKLSAAGYASAWVPPLGD